MVCVSVSTSAESVPCCLAGRRRNRCDTNQGSELGLAGQASRIVPNSDEQLAGYLGSDTCKVTPVLPFNGCVRITDSSSENAYSVNKPD